MFDGASFGKDSRVFFDNTWFSWHTSFDYARFDGYVYFRGSKDNPVFDIVFERHAFWSLLKMENATFDKPDKVFFQSVRLRPSWFVNVTTELHKFNFINVDWKDENDQFINIDGELTIIEKLTTYRSKRLLAIVFRELAQNAENNNRFEEASQFRRMAMETEWVTKKVRLKEWLRKLPGRSPSRRTGPKESTLRKRTRVAFQSAGDYFIHGLYRWTSYYGESWGWAAFVLLVAVLIVFPLTYRITAFQICQRDKPVSMSIAVCESKDPEVNKNCDCVRGRLGFREAAVHSLTTASLQNVDYRKPTTKKGETLVIMEKIFAPAQLALLALALRRKFMR